MNRMLAGVAALALVGTVAGCSASTKDVPGPTTTVTTTAVVEDPSYVWATTTATVTVAPKTTAHKASVTHKPRPAVPTGVITYKVSAGSGQADDVTYTNGGSIEQDTGVSLPWSKSVDDCGTLCEVSAQNAGSGSITCEIFDIDGSLLDKETSNGAYAVVMCQGQG